MHPRGTRPVRRMALARLVRYCSTIGPPASRERLLMRSLPDDLPELVRSTSRIASSVMMASVGLHIGTAACFVLYKSLR